MGIDEEENEQRTLPDLPLSIPGLGNNPLPKVPFEDLIPKEIYENVAANPLGTTLLTGGEPLVSAIKDKPEQPGWFEQVGHELWKMNHLTQAGELAYNVFTENPGTDEVPEGWTAMTPEAVEGFPEDYFGFLTDAKSPKDLEARQNKLREQLTNDERFSNGSLTANLLGGFIGIGLDPTTYLLPMAVGLKYTSLSQNVFLNMAKSAPGMAIDSVSRNMLIQANKAGGSLQEMATDSFRDFIFGTALVGVGGAIGHSLESAKLWNMRSVVNSTADGVAINPIVDSEGVIRGYQGHAMPGGNASAAQVSAANQYINDSMHMGGAFALPFVGEPLAKLLAWGPFASPVLKAMTSPYQSTKNFFNRIVPHGVITTGENLGIARPDTAHDFAQFYNARARSLSQFIRGQYYEANGLTGGANSVNALKNLKQTVSNGKTITEEDFGKEVRRIAYTEGYKSDYPQAHAVADASIKFFEDLGMDYHQARGAAGEFLDPKTAWKYLPQNYHIPAMINDPDGWQTITADALRVQDELITRLKMPMTQTEEQIDLLRTQLRALKNNPEQSKIVKAQIKAQKGLLTKHENDLVRIIRENKDHHILLEDRIMFDESERNQFNTILTPLNLSKSKVIAAESRLKPYLKEKKARVKDESINAKIDAIKKEIEEAKLAVEKEKDALDDLAREGKIDPKFFTQEGWDIKFHEPNKKPSFRKIFDSDFERMSYAKQAYDSILNQSPDDLIQGVLGGLEPGIIENPSYLKQRSIPINSSVYNDAGFLDPDISKSITAYAQTMGKIIGFKKAFPEFANSKGIDGVLGYFQREHQERVDAVLKNPKSTQRDNELKKLNKERTKAEELMKDTYSVYMGTYNQRLKGDTQRWVTSLKNMVYSSKLGAVPLYQLAELGSIVLKTGLMPFMAQGLRPMLKTLNGTLKGKEAQALKDNAANAYLAINHVRSGYAQKLLNPEGMSSPAVNSINQKVGVATDNLAHMSGNLFGTNFIANANETIAANIFQSEVMQAMFAFEKGTITLKQKQKMARYGIQVEKESARFIKAYKESGGWEQNGGYYSNYYQWADSEAANRMSLSMRRMVQDTVVNGSSFTSPYWANNPILNMIFMFHGWAYGALTHYAIPLMQRPDAEHMLGTLMVVGLSMMTEPLLRLANGKKAYDDDTSWFDEAYKAVDYSGILGPYPQFLQDVNNAFGGSLIPRLQSEKYKNRPQNLLGAGGPVGGYLNDVVSSVHHLWKGDLTENDYKRMVRLASFMSHLGIRGVANKYIESYNLPQTRGSAHPWNWRAGIYNE